MERVVEKMTIEQRMHKYQKEHPKAGHLMNIMFTVGEEKIAQLLDEANGREIVITPVHIGGYKFSFKEGSSK